MLACILGMTNFALKEFKLVVPVLNLNEYDADPFPDLSFTKLDLKVRRYVL